MGSGKERKCQKLSRRERRTKKEDAKNTLYKMGVGWWDLGVRQAEELISGAKPHENRTLRKGQRSALQPVECASEKQLCALLKPSQVSSESAMEAWVPVLPKPGASSRFVLGRRK